MRRRWPRRPRTRCSRLSRSRPRSPTYPALLRARAARRHDRLALPDGPVPPRAVRRRSPGLVGDEAVGRGSRRRPRAREFLLTTRAGLALRETAVQAAATAANGESLGGPCSTSAEAAGGRPGERAEEEMPREASREAAPGGHRAGRSGSRAGPGPPRSTSPSASRHLVPRSRGARRGRPELVYNCDRLEALRAEAEGLDPPARPRGDGAGARHATAPDPQRFRRACTRGPLVPPRRDYVLRGTNMATLIEGPGSAKERRIGMRLWLGVAFAAVGLITAAAVYLLVRDSSGKSLPRARPSSRSAARSGSPTASPTASRSTSTRRSRARAPTASTPGSSTPRASC